jgi:MFS family permease
MRRLLFLVGAIVLVESTFFSVLAPLLPRYADEFNLSKAQSGALAAMYAAGAHIGAIPSGILAVRVGAKATVIAGLAIILGTSVAFGLADAPSILYGARFGQGIGSALAWTGGLTWLVAGAPRQQRGELIGIVMGAAVAGALLGPVLGGAARIVGPAPAFAFVAASALLLAGWASVIPVVHPPQRPQGLLHLLHAFREREALVGFWFVSLAAFLLGLISVVAPLRLDELGWGAVAISGAFLVSAAVESALNPFLGRWSDRYGRLVPLRAGLVGSIAISLFIPWIDLRWLALLLVIAAGIAYGVFWVPGTALLSDGTERAGLNQGYGFALLNVAWAPANLVGAVLSGAIADAVGDSGAYLLASSLCLVTLVGINRTAYDRTIVADGRSR